MFKRLFLILVLPLLLLLAQQQLLAHEITHLDSHTQQQNKHQAPHTDFCPQCAQSAGFSSGLLPEISSYLCVELQDYYNDLPKTLSTSYPSKPYSARAPPLFL